MGLAVPAPSVELDERTARPPRYSVPAPVRAEAIAIGAASRSGPSSSRGGSRGSTSSEIESRSSFLITAVAENRAREIGSSVRKQGMQTNGSNDELTAQEFVRST
ncbi:unnamed protein product [Phytophthora fragariaefolia]|uniref:Unnamed protein product n=1 Tax=Phytophthora fragariaefolia TaxID=1490495 RepID=A0A9W6XA76_9STRA|nr:unnamed protein product [Phytophthora fragariaefolia]